MVSENLKILKERISAAAKRCGRLPEDIRLIAVSKYKPLSMILEALEASQTDFGENKAQDLRDKSRLLQGKVTWHFLGHLQANKIKYVVGVAEYIHSLDSLELALGISEKAKDLNLIQKVFLEVKTSGEDTKQGIDDYLELCHLAEFCQTNPNLSLEGLMTMAPLSSDPDAARKSFSSLRELRDRLSGEGLRLKELSMGMSGDFETAIEEGATMVRVGTAVFGPREMNKDWQKE